jgi:hypothetical protein
MQIKFSHKISIAPLMNQWRVRKTEVCPLGKPVVAYFILKMVAYCALEATFSWISSFLSKNHE